MKKESSCNTKRKALFFAAAAFAVILLLPIASSFGDTPKLLATRTINPSELPIKPGDIVELKVELMAVYANGKSFTLTEVIPNGWKFFEGDPKKIRNADKSGLKVKFKPEKDSWYETYSYHLLVPPEPGKEEFAISGYLEWEDSSIPNSGDKSEVKGQNSILVDVKSKSSTSFANLFANWDMATLGLIAVLAVFIIILGLGWKNDKSLSKGEMRRAIAGAFITGFIVITFLAISNNILKDEVIVVFANSAVMVLGFYFGSKAVQSKETKANDQIDNG